MKFVIPGVPLAKARHRTVRRGNIMMMYDPQEKQKNQVSSILMRQMQEAFDSNDKAIHMEASNLAFAGSVSVQIIFYLPYPASATKKSLNRFLWGFPDSRNHYTKPDLSNLIKFAEDAANGILFADDKQIVDITASKRYSLNPRTEIFVMPKPHLDIHQTADAILQTLSPSEFSDIMEITYELSEFANHVSTDSDLANLEKDPQLYRKRLTQAACVISLLAERYSSYLSSIKKKYPNFHSHLDECKTALHKGQP